jgi:hypothetical protein
MSESTTPTSASSHVLGGAWSASLPILEPLINGLDCGVMVVEDEGGIVVANYPLGAMFGLAVDDIRRMTPLGFTEFLIRRVDDPPALLTDRRLFPSDGLAASVEFEITHPFRTVVRWVARRISQPRPGTMVICTDITAVQDLGSTYDRLAVTDRLTGLANRRGAEQMIRREILRARRYAAPITFALFDIDGFRRINQTRGARDRRSAARIGRGGPLGRGCISHRAVGHGARQRDPVRRTGAQGGGAPFDLHE